MFNFRPLDISDMPQMYIWHNTDFVNKWWRFVDYSTLEKVTNQYEARITNDVEHNYIIVLNDMDIGYIQTCLACSYPPYREHINSSDLDNSSCVDIFIGHKDYIYKGYGAVIIREFLKDYVFNNSQVDKCIIGPEPQNFSSIKMAEKVGFEWYKTVQFDDGKEEYLMMLLKNDFKY